MFCYSVTSIIRLGSYLKGLNKRGLVGASEGKHVQLLALIRVKEIRLGAFTSYN